MLSDRVTPGEEDDANSPHQNAYFEEASGLRGRYDSHIMPADYKYKVGTTILCFSIILFEF